MTEIFKTIFENINTPFGSILLLLVLGYLWLRPRFKGIIDKINRVEKVALGNNEVQQIILTALSKTKALTPEDWIQITRLKDAQIEALLKEEEEKENPLKKEESQELRKLYEKIRQGQALTLPEAQRFNTLVEKLKQERPDNSGTWILAALAGLVLGFAIGITVAALSEGRN